MQKNIVYYNTKLNTAFKVYWTFCGEANIKDIKINTGRPVMRSPYKQVPVSDIENKINTGEIIKIYNPKEMQKEINIHNYFKDY